MKYYRFVELQPWMGETHYYYIPTTSTAIPALREISLHQVCYDLQDCATFTEEQVHELVFESENKFHHKVTRVNLPRNRLPEPIDLRNGKAFTVQYNFFKKGDTWVEKFGVAT